MSIKSANFRFSGADSSTGRQGLVDHLFKNLWIAGKARVRGEDEKNLWNSVFLLAKTVPTLGGRNVLGFECLCWEISADENTATRSIHRTTGL